ncbi:MAG: hypothetical protein A2Z86_01395 [Candidatus Glassbacteria bacterium GWA2_58_10]|uniref:Aminoglycoside phosphotransferase domain-containing protein n=1 Tax=Candidatus Glassbacteria bacterium GWA2_58_10 TaxID=1817865 RepID=A0A1F5YES2_9BACT|nr:MAG: hypothetical protein A2Z86_01395 [Candidatus Glassbacteria bacterium GWA2_58_10]
MNEDTSKAPGEIPGPWKDIVVRCLPKAEDAVFLPLYGDASTRAFYRVKRAGRPAVLLVNPAPPANPASGVNENDTYVYIAGLLSEAAPGAPPEIYGYDRAAGLILMEDLGDRHLQTEVLSRGVGSPWTAETYLTLIELLARVQVEAGKKFDPDRSFNPRYAAAFMYEGEGLYFSRFFVGRLCKRDTDRLEAELKELSERAGSLIGQEVLLYRDFQSRNIMLGDNGRLRLLDFQGARSGPPAYDLASLLYDPYLPLPEALRERLVSRYPGVLSAFSAAAAEMFTPQWPLIAAHRLMQVLGAYAKLALVDAKKQYLQYIPRALKDFSSLLNSPEFGPFPLLRETVRELEDKKAYQVIGD